MADGELPVRPLPLRRRHQGAARGDGGHRCRRSGAHRRRGGAWPRPRQHPRQRPRPRRDRGRRPGARRAPWRGDQCRAGRRARQQFPPDPRRRGRFAAGAAADRSDLGPGGRPARDPGRQGRGLRHGRPRHQAVLRDAADEEGYGRRRRGARGGRHGHGRRSQAAPARAHPGGGERGLGQCLPPRRRVAEPRRTQRRDRQHRRGGPADPRRRPGAGRCGRRPS